MITEDIFYGIAAIAIAACSHCSRKLAEMVSDKFIANPALALLQAREVS